MDKLSKEIIVFTKNDPERKKMYEAFNVYMKDFEHKRATHKQHSDMLKVFFKELSYFTKTEISETTDLEEFLKFTHNKEAVFAILTRMLNQILPDYVQPQLGLLADTQYGAWNDTFEFKLTPRDLFTVSKVGKNKRRFNVQRQYNSEVTLHPELHALTVGIPFWEVMLGKYTLGEFMSKAARSLVLAMQTDVLESFIGFFEDMPITPPYDKVKFSGWNETSMLKLARRVRGWNNSEPILFGTQLALNNVLPNNANYDFKLDDPYVTEGFIRQIGRVRTVEMDAVVDMAVELGIFREDIIDKRIYVLSPGSDKIVKLAVAGSGMSNSDATFENANKLLTGTIHQGWKAQVITNSVAGVIELA